MKRYRIKSKATSVRVGDASTTVISHIKVTEVKDGKWVKYEDVAALLYSILYLNVDGSVVECQYMEGINLCDYVPDPEFLKEVLK